MFEPIAPFVQRSETSLEAALSIAPHLEPLEAQVLGLLAAQEGAGATDEELLRSYVAEHGLRLSGTIRARRIKLVHKGLVRDSGHTRPGVSGRQMTVWVVGA